MSTGTICRFCGAVLSRVFVDLGETPLANRFIAPEDAAPEPRYPLRVYVCDACMLVQLGAGVPPEVMFADYPYFSSYSRSWLEHCERFANVACRRFSLGPSSKVVEIASNDGHLLRAFQASGVAVLGVDPAANVARAAEANGVPTEVAFFGQATAERLHSAGHTADLVVANNVLAHVPDLNDFVAGLALLVKPEGVVTCEFPHLLRLIEGVQFDTIYHEHVSYFSLGVVERVFAAHGLTVTEVETLLTHGGSLRIHARRTGAANGGMAAVRAAESAAGLESPAGYTGFAAHVERARGSLRALLARVQQDGKTVAAYGAAAKGNTLLNVCGIGRESIAYVVDRSPHKQGKLTPGSHIPVHAPEQLEATKPDYVLILPWNLRDEIARDMAHIGGWGGRFVIPVPECTVLG